MSIRPRRSMLYMPGSNARALEKARTLDADAVILDLEDAVAPDAKEMAREQVAAAVKAGGFGKREVLIRVNGPMTQWGAADLAAAIQAAPDGILVPKIQGAMDVQALLEVLEEAGTAPHVKLWLMMETPSAILSAREIADVCFKDREARLAGFVLGLNDLAKETRARLLPGRAAFVPAIMTCVLAARMHRLDVIDGVYNAIKDPEGFRAECEQAVALGLDGKTLIHPDQIAIANAAFSPSADEVAWARRVIAAFEAPEAAGKGALQIDGKMVELLHVGMAQRTVAIAEAIAG